MAQAEPLPQAKLGFTVVGCTGEEPGCAAAELELLQRSPGSQGWQSPRYAPAGQL